MKKLYFLLFLAFSFIANAQIVNIPDANFKAKLLSASPTNGIAKDLLNNSIKIDLNDNGEIEINEALNVSFLNINNSSITNLIGINSFTNLFFLHCNHNQLLNLDISNLLGLKELSCGYNQLTSLNISNNQVLEIFSASSNQLTNINVSQNVNLKTINLSNNQILDLNIMQNQNLDYLDIANNLLTSLDISQNQLLQSLIAANNSLLTINLGVNNILYYIQLQNNQLSTVNLSQLPLLSIIDIGNNYLENLDVSENSNLKSLSLNNNQLTSLDVGQNLFLEALYVGGNQLTNLDVNQNLLLEVLNVVGNQLISLDVTNNNVLTYLLCDNISTLETLFIKNDNPNGFFSLFFSNNPSLEFVCCNTNDLALVQQKITDYGYANCQVSNISCDYPFLYEVSGNVQYDYNGDGCNNAWDDMIVPNVKYEVFDGINTITTFGNQLGEYFLPLEEGNYAISPVIENPNYFNVSPPNFSVNFPADISPFEQNVCLTWNGLDYFDDLEVVIIPTTPARPGFEVKYKVIVRNKGYDETNGLVTLTYDNSILTYVSSAPVLNSSTVNTISWNFYSIPFQTKEMEVTFNLNSSSDSPAVNIDDELNFIADVIHDWTDYTPTDNTFTLDQTVVGSYDPNDKTCLQGETVDVSMVGDYVHYLIRFENTGTYAAQKVVVEDVIDTSKFDVSTLIPLDASHAYYTKITDNVVEFIFENINLDFNDATNDGYVAFKIKTLPSLTVGDTFSNDANIYFDYNFPITTNTYTTTVNNVLNNQDFAFENEFTLYPNPTKDILNISSKNQTEIQSVEIYNIIGQVVIAIPNTTKTIDVSSLESGTYFVKVNTEKGSTTTKFIKE